MKKSNNDEKFENGKKLYGKDYKDMELLKAVLLNHRPNQPDYTEIVHEEFFKEFWMPHRFGYRRVNAARSIFNNSYFLPKCFDDCIIGINVFTESVVYNFLALSRNYMIYYEYEGSPSYMDQLYGRVQVLDWIRNLSKEELNGKVPPTLIGLMENIKFEEYYDFYPQELDEIQLEQDLFDYGNKYLPNEDDEYYDPFEDLDNFDFPDDPAELAAEFDQQ